MLESTLESTLGELIVNSGTGSHTPCLSLNTFSVLAGKRRKGGKTETNAILSICRKDISTQYFSGDYKIKKIKKIMYSYSIVSVNNLFLLHTARRLCKLYTVVYSIML